MVCEADDTSGHRSPAEFVCVHCGRCSKSLYRRYSPSIIRITHCDACGAAVDKYIECDSLVIFLDILLHRVQAFRHVYFNTSFKSTWCLRLAFMCLLCEAFHKWSSEHAEEQVITAAIELSFYCKLLLTGVEYILFATACFATSLLPWLLQPDRDRQNVSSRLVAVFCALVLSSYGNLFILGAYVWMPSYMISHCAWFVLAFVFTSSIQSLRVALGLGMLSSAACIASGLLVSRAVILCFG